MPFIVVFSSRNGHGFNSYVKLREGTMLGPPLISLFISPSNYSYLQPYTRVIAVMCANLALINGGLTYMVPFPCWAPRPHLWILAPLGHHFDWPWQWSEFLPGNLTSLWKIFDIYDIFIYVYTGAILHTYDK